MSVPVTLEPTSVETRAGRHWYLLSGALLAVMVWLFIARRAELAQLVAVLAQGQWSWVLAAGLLQVAYYAVYAGLYQAAFATAGVPVRLRDLLAPVFQSLVINVAVPGAGVGVILGAAVRQGGTLAGAAAGAILVRVADFGMFVAILLVALAHLFATHHLHAYEVVAAVVLLISTVAWAMALVLGLWRPAVLLRALQIVQRAAGGLARLLRRKHILPDGWAERQAGEFRNAAGAVAGNPAGLARTLGVALAAHAIDIASLYALFIAFRQPVSFGVLVTGFAIGILFWVVSITPQGIGLVEGMMALVFSQLGVPLVRGTVIALAFRGLTFWLPLLVGAAMLHRLAPAPRAPEKRNRDPLVESLQAYSHGSARWGVRTVALLTVGMGVVNLLSAVLPALHDRLLALAPYLPLYLRQGARLTSALAGFALILLASGLWRGKRAAWWLTMITLAVSVFSHLLKGLDYEEAILATLLMAVLVALRPHFQARSDAPSVSQGVRAVLVAALFSLAYGVAGFYLLDRHFRVDFGMADALRQTVVMFAEFRDPGLEPVTGFGRYFADSIYIVAAATMAYAMTMLLRPVLLRHPPSPVERERAQGIVEAHGRSSLARLALLPDKYLFFSPGGSLISYAVKGRIALSLGDPIGPSSDLSPTLRAFEVFCAGNDWSPAYYQTLPDHLEAYRAMGYSVLTIGDEDIVDLPAFTLEGGAAKSLRSTVHRLERQGYSACLYSPPHSDEVLENLRAVSDDWLDMMGGVEKGFSLGWFAEDYLRECPVMAVLAPGGAPVAFANIIPEYRRNEATIDLMRRRRDAPSGTMDFLFVSLFRWARERGYDTFNLGMSPLAGVGDAAGDPAVERALHFIYEHVNQFYGFKGLHAYKEKFHPNPSPRFLVYPSLASLPAVVMALLRADAGDEFLWDAMRDLTGSLSIRPRAAGAR